MSEKITVLFTQKDSVYKKLGCNCYDKERNAIAYKGVDPVIAHPPCRAWGKLKGMAKPEPGEKDLALWAMELINRNGGILEHPKASDLFRQADTEPGFLLPIQQKDFGHEARKDTFLYIVGTTHDKLPVLPLILGEPEQKIQNMQRKQREQTPENLAKWLIKTLEVIKNDSR
jgi:hypothetical protein